MVNCEKALLFSESQLVAANQWFCKRRINYTSNADIWAFRFHWPETKHKILAEVNSEDYWFYPLQQLNNHRLKPVS